VRQVSFAAAGLLVGSSIMVPVALLNEGLPSLPTEITPIFGVIYLGIFPTAIATLLLVRVIKSTGPSFLSLVNYQVPVWAVVFGIIILGEPLPTSFLGALALILLGLGISQKKRRTA
jgi:drug/metabolite transporter (DMT)-like permease